MGCNLMQTSWVCGKMSYFPSFSCLYIMKLWASNMYFYSRQNSRAGKKSVFYLVFISCKKWLSDTSPGKLSPPLLHPDELLNSRWSRLAHLLKIYQLSLLLYPWPSIQWLNKESGCVSQCEGPGSWKNDFAGFATRQHWQTFSRENAIPFVVNYRPCKLSLHWQLPSQRKHLDCENCTQLGTLQHQQKYFKLQYIN